jgi:Protein of unknown function (DUF2892)
MKRNVARWERIARTVAGAGMLAGSFLAPLPPLVRLLAFGGGGLYLLATALAGTCLGYKMLGISTCPVDQTKPR